MKKKKKHLIGLLFSAMLFLFLILTVKAQPTCFSNFNPFETCDWAIQNKEFVFLGRVVSIDDQLRGNLGTPSKIVVEVETPLKGNLSGRTELFLDVSCVGSVYQDQRYIFTAERVHDGKFSKIYSKRWTTKIGDEYSQNEINNILDEIRSVVQNIRQPRLVGRVIQQDWSPEGRYLMRGTDIGTKLRYDPNYAHPLENVVVAARTRDGREFKTKTNADGKYAFKDLPHGKYEVYTNLSKEYDVDSSGLMLLNENDIAFVEIDDALCSRDVSFNAQLQGDIQIRFDNASSRWDYIALSLWHVGERYGERQLDELTHALAKDKFETTTGSGDIGFNHLFKNVPIGKYVLMLSITVDPSRAHKTVFFPGTFELEKATVIDVKAGKTADINFRLPDFQF